MVTDYYCKSTRFSRLVALSLYTRGIGILIICVVWWLVGGLMVWYPYDHSTIRSYFVSVVMVIMNRQTDGRTDYVTDCWRGDLSHLLCCV